MIEIKATLIFFKKTNLFQVSKKEKLEHPRTATITLSEKTHFRVISNSDGVEDDILVNASVCTVLKPEPRTHPFLKELDIKERLAPSATEQVLEILQDSPAFDSGALPSPLVDSPSDTKPSAKLDSPSKKKGTHLLTVFPEINDKCIY